MARQSFSGRFLLPSRASGTPKNQVSGEKKLAFQ